MKFPRSTRGQVMYPTHRDHKWYLQALPLCEKEIELQNAIANHLWLAVPEAVHVQEHLRVVGAVSRGAPARSTLIGTSQGPATDEPVLPHAVLFSQETRAVIKNGIRNGIEIAMLEAMMIDPAVRMTGTSTGVLLLDVLVAAVAGGSGKAVGIVTVSVTGTERKIEKGIGIEELGVVVRTEGKTPEGIAAGPGVRIGGESP